MVTRLHCPQCETTIEGFFRSREDPFAALDKEQMDFLVGFVRCEGRFNRMEKEMGMSYPTLRNRLDEIMNKLGFEPEADEPAKPKPKQRRKILEDLESGEITFEKAQALLRGEQVEEEV